MNERIKELEVQAIEYANQQNTFDPRSEFSKKFAELILAECTEVLLKWKGEPFPFDEELAASLIKEHFGVK
jgi:hypothetical protein